MIYIDLYRFQLQIILVLEVLSLRREMGDVTQNLLEKQSKIQSKNESINIEQYLDVLVDRLCIWQALSDTRLLDDNSINLEPDNDQLKQFCAEVVIPFYASKLPDVCNMLSVKCGGPSFSYHALRVKRTKKSKTSTKEKSDACSTNVSAKSSKVSLGSSKTSASTIFCPETALFDKKTKLTASSVTSRFSSTDKHTKSISRDGILNSKQSLEHREIKMPLKPIGRKGSDRIDDISLHVTSSVSLPSLQTRGTEVCRTRVKQNTAKVQIQVLETPQKNRITHDTSDLTIQSAKRIIGTPISHGSIGSPVKKCRKVEYVTETPLRK
ncbi:uncharacterized protein T551_00685 [Pneumocystis jirovecii RU7]|uniref:DNA replication regulator Sld3 C-terminal domain-containing protein n=1 Tax=Pneumocystis jirovecii (strain RU7) TaxID=1408657 RepID=A0A0W4ZUI1_PNEJ7|nr:uncharacterized protein T551_00685 [Pneumocystis jirovecii RU7]KTW32003.1 hypothetical protein T551_00685 [Pneumocystis jirovecii RU7]